jgi:hypothetical protein
MLRIEYEIKLNDEGRPCIDLAKDYQDKPEDKFFAIELARYVLQNVYNRRSAEFDAEAAKTIDASIRLLGQVGDEMAEILFGTMKSMGDVTMMMDNKYHFIVDSIEERDNLGVKYMVANDKIIERQEGVKVMVRTYHVGEYDRKIYELRGGITNEHWVEI